VVAGHVWPLFAGFRGGRGVLTGGAVLLALSPLATLAILPVAGLILYQWRYMSLMSISAALLAVVSFAAFAAVGWHPWAFVVAAAIGGALIVVLHHDNIERLRAGTERKVGQRVEAGPAAAQP
jgi:glycerol-3-phosphate acyltransferase PlsY